MSAPAGHSWNYSQSQTVFLTTSADLLCRYLLLRTHQLPLDAFLVALNMMQVEDVDLDEVQCILANLIYMVSSHAPQSSARGLTVGVC